LTDDNIFFFNGPSVPSNKFMLLNLQIPIGLMYNVSNKLSCFANIKLNVPIYNQVDYSERNLKINSSGFFEVVVNNQRSNIGVLFSNIVYAPEIGISINFSDNISCNLSYNQSVNSFFTDHEPINYSSLFGNARPKLSSMGFGISYRF
jgi:hypothetical protein